MPAGSSRPETAARERIDAGLGEAGRIVQHRDEMNLAACRGVAVREFKLTTGHGFAGVDWKTFGVIEAKPEGHTLSGIEVQAEQYATGLRHGLDPPVQPLPFLYLSTEAVTKIADDLRAALGQIEDLLGDLDWRAVGGELV